MARQGKTKQNKSKSFQRSLENEIRAAQREPVPEPIVLEPAPDNPPLDAERGPVEMQRPDGNWRSNRG